jgi:hypothetical protein
VPVIDLGRNATVIDEIRTTIREQVADGASLEQVDSEFIDSLAELDDDARSSLWLYAWHCAESRRDPTVHEPELILTG